MKPIPTRLILAAIGIVPPEAGAQPEAFPAAAWIEKLSAAPSDPGADAIRMGCYHRVTTRPILYPKLSRDAVSLMETYDAWVRARGGALADKWASGQALTDQEQEYAGPAKAAYFFRALSMKGGAGISGNTERPQEWAAVQNTMDRGGELMRKGYSGRLLTAEDIEGLRDYRILSAMQWTGFKIMPFEYGMAAKDKKGTEPGVAAPDFSAISLDAVTSLPTYTDDLQQDVTSFLKPGGAVMFLQLFTGYDSAVANGKTICVPRKDVIPSTIARGGIIHLSSLKGKPVLFVLSYAPDVFWKVIAAPLEALQHFYGDRAHIMHININYHDTYATGPVYAGAAGGDEAVKLVHPQTLEQRARMSRAVALMFLNISYRLAMDDSAQSIRNSYCSEGGAGECVVVDQDGNIVYDPGKGWDYWTKGPYTDSVMWLNETEIALRHALGLFAEPLPGQRSRYVGQDRPSRRKAFAGRDAKPYGYGMPDNHNIWLAAKVAKIGSGAMEVHPCPPPKETMRGFKTRETSRDLKLGKIAERNFSALNKWLQDSVSGISYLFTIDESVELFVNGAEAELDSFRPGDTVAIWYPLDQNPASGVKPIQVRTSRF